MKKKFIKNKRDQLWIAISFVTALILSLLIALFSPKTSFDMNPEISADTNVIQKGSAVRKETHNRKNYERDYRKKSSEWQEQYSKILENKEDDKNLKPLQSQDTNKNEN